ncbi:MAG: hypothetical protein ACREP9_10255 [Candidatus Dormibacteraceae bacterium]
MAKIYDNSLAIWPKPYDANLNRKYDVKKTRNNKEVPFNDSGDLEVRPDRQ